jgi:hypothetical protein
VEQCDRIASIKAAWLRIAENSDPLHWSRRWLTATTPTLSRLVARLVFVGFIFVPVAVLAGWVR